MLGRWDFPRVPPLQPHLLAELAFYADFLRVLRAQQYCVTRSAFLLAGCDLERRSVITKPSERQALQPQHDATIDEIPKPAPLCGVCVFRVWDEEPRVSTMLEGKAPCCCCRWLFLLFVRPAAAAQSARGKGGKCVGCFGVGVRA